MGYEFCFQQHDNVTRQSYFFNPSSTYLRLNKNPISPNVVYLYPKNNKTTCFTMKIDLKKLETAFPPWSASKFPFSSVSFPPLFYFSQIRLLVTGFP